MSIRGLCRAHTYDVLLYLEKQGSAMGSSREWTPRPGGNCRFVILSSGVAGQEVRIRDYTMTHAVYFSADPEIPNGSRIRWTGTRRDGDFATPIVMTLGGPINFDSTARLWKVYATTHELANLETGAIK